jgi:hypothetical protein
VNERPSEAGVERDRRHVCIEPCHVSLIAIKQASEHNERFTEEFMKRGLEEMEAGNCAVVANRF